jgi:hypothetical protein
MTGGIQVYLTPTIESFLVEAWSFKQSMPLSLQTSLESFIPDPSSSELDDQEHGIPFSLLKETQEWMRDKLGKEIFLHELLRESRHFIPAPLVPEKDPALVARLKKMRHQVENRIYAKMVANVANDMIERDKIADRVDLKSGMDTAKMGLNLLLSVISVFTAVYFVVHAAYQNTILSVSAASMGAIAIFLVETILFVLRGAQLDARVAKDRHDELHGISSPFPPAAPSLVEAQRKKRQERIQEAEKQKKLIEDAANAKNDSTTTMTMTIENLVESKGPVLEEEESDSNSLPEPLLPCPVTI